MTPEDTARELLQPDEMVKMLGQYKRRVEYVRKLFGGIPARTVYDLIKCGWLDAVNLGACRWFITDAGIETIHRCDFASCLPRPQDIIGAYFIAHGDHVKIGFSSNIRARYEKLANERKNADEFELLGWIACRNRLLASELERALHLEFAAARHHGEWFALTHEAVYECIARHETGVRLPK